MKQHLATTPDREVIYTHTSTITGVTRSRSVAACGMETYPDSISIDPECEYWVQAGMRGGQCRRCQVIAEKMAAYLARNRVGSRPSTDVW